MKRAILYFALAVLLTGCFVYDECRSQCDCWYKSAYKSCGGIVP